MANSFFWQHSRTKVVTIICLSLFLTKILSPVLSNAEPQNLNWQQLKKQLSFKLPTLNTLPLIASLPKPFSAQDHPAPTLMPTQPFIFVPSSNPNQPSPTLAPIRQPLVLPTSTNRQLTLVPNNPTTNPTISSPKPTKAPKPTKPPKPTPFQLSNPRPGKDFRDIAKIVGPIMCVPPAMIYAIYDNEAGYLGPQALSNWEYYNTYQGSDPTDIPESKAVFGVTQMMGDTWHKIKPYVGAKLGTTELSLNVTFDSMAAGAYYVGNVSLAWKDKVGCTDWPVSYILYGACRYNGACPADTFGQKEYYNSYTYNVCASYNEYGGAQKKCQ